MKKFSCLLFILYAPVIFSQQKISGLITDSLKKPVAFASIGLFSQPQNELVKGTITDEKGNYAMDKLKSGSYLLRVFVSGYQEKRIESLALDSTRQDLILDITLSVSTINLKGVDVVASKRVVEFKNNNMIVNVEDSPLAQGNTVFDILSKLPGVTIEDKELQLQGKTGVIVMIDDRPQMISGDQLLNLLKGMNGDLIKSIEVLKNPPVKYDASGTSGMINIKTKKATIAGITGSVFSSYSQGFYPQSLLGASFNYKTKKIIFYSNVSGSNQLARTQQTFNRQFATDSSVSNLNTTNVVRGIEKNLNYKAGVDWYLTNIDIIGVKVEGAPGSYTERIDSRNELNDPALNYNHLNSQLDFFGKWNSTNVNFNYEHKCDTVGSAVLFVADYTALPTALSTKISSRFFNPNEQLVKPLNNINGNNMGESNIFSARADYNVVMDSVTSIETGLKMSNTAIKNNYLIERDSMGKAIFVTDIDLSNNYTYDEMTYAAYVNYKKVIGKLSMNLGLRFENTYLKGENTSKNLKLKRNYFNVFPNFTFDYHESELHDFQLNLSRRINRPDFEDLSPFQIFIDQYTYQQGNPFLLPDYSNKAELSYGYKQALYASIAYSYMERIIMGYTLQYDSLKIVDQRIKNMNSAQSLEYSLYYQKSITDKWELAISGTFMQVNFKGDIGGVEFNNTRTNYSGNLSSSYLITKKLKFEINGFYAGPSYHQVLRRESRSSLSTAIKISMCNDKLDLTVGIDDIFYSAYWRTSVNFENQNWNFKQVNDSRRFRIALNYTFGKTRIEERNINSSNEEEKDRFKH